MTYCRKPFCGKANNTENMRRKQEVNLHFFLFATIYIIIILRSLL